ncbi:helix-turn-helix transcriptional regulator [Flavobacterium psychrophilum]|uniref:Helix-turn-helix transcriptional regulator n=10 Tax=Flavobacterium psychrophilum TaxID=96345 RepID=A0A076NT59_FLAPS|nr:AraC family transcriptional regulator [Flavobacterium psychrophilum]AIN74722.1 AraC family transcriptional regulator [Flavobacterium psychrophilum FPG3]AIG29805.1 AraC family transcriptional regulator [Flavobacterium psychrophilum]AIG32082.1 AraC family transcriptional regulator [Flavobacterium psychrophilum]AIG34237.1 AraC family transcriptional regulator [Flavobacterium psychrophilum]AIG36600.1 AraC family transcriptional regulator [Flavobacterium psychrophilum]
MENYKNLQDTLSFFNIDCNNSYYISTGKSIFEFPNEPFRMDYYTFCICTKGEIDLEINGIKYKISLGSIICSAPSTIVHFLNATNDFQMQLVFFDKIFLLTNISDPYIIEKMGLFQNDSYSIVNTSKKNIKNVLNIVGKLKNEEKNTSDFIIPKIRTLIFLLLIEIAEIYIKVAPETIADKDPQTNLFFRFNKLIQENILLHKEVTFYANQLCVSNKYLIEITKKTTGKTPHEIINEALFKESVVLLGNPNLSISEIAYKLQFNSISAFGRFFKHQNNCSPSDYKRGR